MIELYSDGGVIKSNPSTIGGTWAWCIVANGCKVASAEGVVTPVQSFGPVTNNYTELLAAVKGLEQMPEHGGTLYTDSRITMLRLTISQSFVGIPEELRRRALHLRKHSGCRVILVAGHPTKAELLAGRRQRNGLPTSIWNVRCDRACREAGEAYLKKHSQ